MAGAGYPGSKQIPAVQAMLALLAPKLLGKRRVSHITDLASDEGAGLCAGSMRYRRQPMPPTTRTAPNV